MEPIQLDLTQKEIDFLKNVWNVDDPTDLLNNMVRVHLNQLVNQQLGEVTTADKIDIINTKASAIEKVVV